MPTERDNGQRCMTIEGPKSRQTRFPCLAAETGQSSSSGAIRQTTCTWNADQRVGVAVCSPLLSERSYIGELNFNAFLGFLVST
jgi:hypothetical protein